MHFGALYMIKTIPNLICFGGGSIKLSTISVLFNFPTITQIFMVFFHFIRPQKVHTQILVKCQLSYLMMPILNGACQYVWKDAVVNKNTCHFFGPSPSALSEKKFKAQEHIQMRQRCALDFFPSNTLGDGPAFWIFPGFTDKG